MILTNIFTLPSSNFASQISGSNELIRAPSTHNVTFCKFKLVNFCANPLSLKPISVAELFVPNGSLSIGRHSIFTSSSSSSSSSKPFFSPVMEWQDCTVKMEVDVPASLAYEFYDREAMPQWMRFISSVKTEYDQVLEEKPDQSRWTLKFKAFGLDIEFFWLSRNLQPIPNQKIHWRSLEGLPNSGAVRLYPKGPSSCLIELNISYEVPQLLAPVALALQPLLQNLLLQGLEMFATFARSYQSD